MLNTISIDATVFTIQLFGNDFALLKSQACKNLSPIGKVIFDEGFPFIEEVIATEAEIYLKLNDSFSRKDLTKLCLLKTTTLQERTPLKLPVFFDAHHDWKNILSKCNLSKTAFVNDVCKQDYSVAMFGFLPGFVYLNGLPKHLHISRKKNPSLQIPANSLAIGGKYLGIYSIPSPGGWHIVGKIATPILSLKQLPPISLSIEHRLLIEAIDEPTYIHLTNSNTTFSNYNGLA